MCPKQCVQAAGLQQIRSGPAMRSRIIELQQSKSLLPDHVICTRALEKPDPVTIILSTTASSDSLIELLFSLTRTI